jgi:hypothetical protein
VVHLPRRHFFQARNEKHYNKRGNTMGGISLDGLRSDYMREQFTPEHKIQESIDALNAAIERLDKIINEMGQNNGTNNKPR